MCVILVVYIDHILDTQIDVIGIARVKAYLH